MNRDEKCMKNRHAVDLVQHYISDICEHLNTLTLSVRGSSLYVRNLTSVDVGF